jgi:hypothetical protein
VHLELVKPEVLADRGGPFNFGHREKIFGIKQVLEKFGDCLVGSSSANRCANLNRCLQNMTKLWRTPKSIVSQPAEPV